MNAYSGPSGAAPRHALVMLLAVAAVAVASCGSSKPGYCNNVSKLKESVSSLSVSGGLSGLKNHLDQIADEARGVVSSAKGDFPDQTSAVKASISRLQDSIAGIASSPSAAQLATVASEAKGVVKSVEDFASATKSKCQ